MNTLIVLGHPEPKSFNGALRERAAATLGALGHAVRMSDLYARGFGARVTRGDFTAARDPDFFKVTREQAHAWKTNGFAPDIAREMDDLRWAELVILQFPMWWFGPPAVMKGWIDRVFVPGLTYGRGAWFETGGMKGKRALVSITIDTGAEAYGPYGRYGEIETVLWPVHLSLRFVGFDVLRPFFAAKVSESDETRKALLAAYDRRLRGLDAETPIAFRPSTDYGENDVLKVKQGA